MCSGRLSKKPREERIGDLVEFLQCPGGFVGRESITGLMKVCHHKGFRGWRCHFVSALSPRPLGSLFLAVPFTARRRGIEGILSKLRHCALGTGGRFAPARARLGALVVDAFAGGGFGDRGLGEVTGAVVQLEFALPQFRVY